MEESYGWFNDLWNRNNCRKNGRRVHFLKDRVIGYYDAVGIKHFYLEVDEMDDEELKALYINSFAKE